MIPYAVTITKSGTGTGTVTSDIHGIDCGATCFVGIDFVGDPITLVMTATPDAGSYFVGWTGVNPFDLVTPNTDNPVTWIFNTGLGNQILNTPF